jgi:hypothetical protein
MTVIYNRECDITSIPRWHTVRVQILSGEDWNKVLLSLQTCGPGKGRSRTTSFSKGSPLQTTNDRRTLLHLPEVRTSEKRLPTPDVTQRMPS